ncbi:MAG: RNA polymerase sigma factor [Pseudomonadota bacterium]
MRQSQNTAGLRFIRMALEKNAHESVRTALAEAYPRLWRFCLTTTGRRDRADDLAQMASLRALEKAHLFEPGTALDRWVFRIAQRIWLNELRAETVRQGGGVSQVDDIDLPDERASTETNVFARQVFATVMALPEAQRTAVVLVYVEGYSYKEAAAILEIPIGTVMSRLAAARARLSSPSSEAKGARA